MPQVSNLNILSKANGHFGYNLGRGCTYLVLNTKQTIRDRTEINMLLARAHSFDAARFCCSCFAGLPELSIVHRNTLPHIAS